MTGDDARNRNFNKFRMSGMYKGLHTIQKDKPEIMSPKEKELIESALVSLYEVISQFETTSVQLGFKDVGRRVGRNRGKITKW